MLHSEEGLLAGIFRWPEIDRLLEKARTSEPGRCPGIYADVEAVLRCEALVVPFFHETIYRFCHPGVRGLRFGLTVPEVYYEELSFRGVPTS